MNNKNTHLNKIKINGIYDIIMNDVDVLFN